MVNRGGIVRVLLVVSVAMVALASVEATAPSEGGNTDLWPHLVSFTPPTKPTKFHDFLYYLYGKKRSTPWASDVVVGAAETSVSPLSHYGFTLAVSGLLSISIKNENTALYMCTPPVSPTCFSLAGQQSSDLKGMSRFVGVPAPSPNTPSIVPARAVLTADNTVAPVAVFTVAKGTQTVVFDIDGTLTTGNIQQIEEIVLRIIGLNYRPKINPGAAAVVNEWYQKGYMVVYLTGRPGALHHLTLEWLVEEGLPPGVVHLCETKEQVKNVQDYKTAFVASLQSQGADVVAGYGNEPTDIGAYYANGIAKDRTFIFGPHGGEQGSVSLQDYTDHLTWVQAQPAATVPRPVMTSATTFI